MVHASDAGGTTDPEARILVHAPFGRDAAALVELATGEGAEAVAAGSVEDLIATLNLGFRALVLTEEALTARSGAVLAMALAEQPSWSDAPILVLVSNPERPPPGLAALDAPDTKAILVVLRRPASAVTISSALRALLAMRARQCLIRDQFEEIEARRSHLRFLLGELDHRVKNTLAKVRSIARLSVRHEPDPDTFFAAFSARLDALARAHDLLAGDHDRPAGLRAVVEGALAPFRDEDGANLRIAGPDLPMWPKATVTLGLILHELATNASKHGALSVPGGQVLVEWSVRLDGSRSLELLWRETGGPPVQPTDRRSFGRLLIEEIAPRDLGGTVELAFAPQGVRCRISAPLPEGAEGPVDRAGQDRWGPPREGLGAAG